MAKKTDDIKALTESVKALVEQNKELLKTKEQPVDAATKEEFTPDYKKGYAQGHEEGFIMGAVIMGIVDLVLIFAALQYIKKQGKVLLTYE